MYNFKKVLSPSQIRAADNFTIKNKPISSLALMESAAEAFVNAFVQYVIKPKKIVILCGTGNNGGDGFAICRILKSKGFEASAVLVKIKGTLSLDCEVNKNRIKEVSTLNASSPTPNFSNYDIIIDAILGSGLNAPITGFVSKIIEAVNNSGKEVYSVDVPSGLPCDRISKSECVVKADHVISFQRPKLSFFFPENSKYLKTWEAVNIGLEESFIQEQASTYFIADKSASKLVKHRHKQSHKGTYGHALIVAGSHGKMGAAVLSARACLRSGVGLLTCHVPKCGYEIMQISIPEAMCLTDKNPNILTTLPTEINHFDSIGIGPGIGKDGLTSKMVEDLLKNKTQPLVLDADALNILSENKSLIKLLPENTILTPHVKEFDRLIGESKNTLERYEKQQRFSTKHKAIIVLKGAYTSISCPNGNLYFNTTGNPGMATGGSGDVLTGIITGLLAQKYEPLTATIIAVHFHGKAGDKAAKSKGYEALIASDIIESLKIG